MKRVLLATILILVCSSFAEAYTIVLGWDANPAIEQVTSYRVFQDGTLKSTVATNQATISGVTGGHSWYIVAVNKDGLVALPSNTVTYPGEPGASKNLKITVTVDVQVP